MLTQDQIDDFAEDYYAGWKTTPERNLPTQPVYKDEHGTLRFHENKIVRHLLDWASERGLSLNEIAVDYADGKFDQAEMEQFAQLIGYSISGFGELSYVSEHTWDRVHQCHTYRAASIIAEAEREDAADEGS